jgi:hypothetical protein
LRLYLHEGAGEPPMLERGQGGNQAVGSLRVVAAGVMTSTTRMRDDHDTHSAAGYRCPAS